MSHLPAAIFECLFDEVLCGRQFVKEKECPTNYSFWQKGEGEIKSRYGLSQSHSEMKRETLKVVVVIK